MSMLGAWIRRMRHRRGFGVHSPLAFRVVKEVLWPARDYGFYDENAIRSLSSDPLRTVLLRAWRLACWEKIPLEIVGNLAPALNKIISMRAPRSASAPRLILILNCEDASNLPPYPEGSILYVWTGKRPSGPEELPGELLLLLPDGFIAFNRPNTPRLCYDF